MTLLSSFNRYLLSTVMAFAVLCSWLYLTPPWIPQADPQTSKTPDDYTRANLKAQPALNPRDYVSIAQRPLFTPGRRPDISAHVEKTGGRISPAPLISAPTTAGIILEGVIFSDDVRIAFVRTNEASPIQNVKAGETIAGWRIVAIHKTSLQVTSTSPNANQIVTVHLHETNSSKRRTPRMAPAHNLIKAPGRPPIRK